MFRAIYELFFGKRLEFYTAYPLSDAVSKLQSLEDEGRKTLFGKRIRTRTVMMKPKHHFVCRQNFGENVDVYCKGHFEPELDGVTIIGRTYVGWFTRCFLIFGNLWLVGWTFASLAEEMYGMTIFGMVFIGLLYAGRIKEQRKLHTSIYQALGKSKKKKR